MEQKGLFEDEEKIGGEEEFKTFTEPEPAGKKGRTKLFLVIGLLLIAGAYAANMFLSKEAAAPPPAPKRLPITGVPVMATATSVKEEARKPEEAVKAGKKVAEPKTAGKADVKKAKAEPKPAAKAIAKAEPKKAEAKEPGKGGLAVVIGTYAARYETDAAKETLKGTGITPSVREVKRKLTMNRVLIREVKDKAEARALESELRENGYEPFREHIPGGYKVFAVSNLSEENSERNKKDLEGLGYTPTIEKKEVSSKVLELYVPVKSEEEGKEKAALLSKKGFKPEVKR